MEAVSISEMSGNFYETTRRNNPEDSHLQKKRKINCLLYKLGVILAQNSLFTLIN
jgi:hypothetical protein